MGAAQLRDRHDPAGLTLAARRFLAANPELQTPFLVLDLDVVEERYRALTGAMPVTGFFTRSRRTRRVKCSSG
jgi:diaminopimelate decarboxylase